MWNPDEHYVPMSKSEVDILAFNWAWDNFVAAVTSAIEPLTLPIVIWLEGKLRGTWFDRP